MLIRDYASTVARRYRSLGLDFSSHLRHKRPHECGRGTQECVRHALIRRPAFEAVAQTLVFVASALSRKLANRLHLCGRSVAPAGTGSRPEPCTGPPSAIQSDSAAG